MENFMNKEQFTQDIQKIYDFITEQKAQINKLYEYLEKGQNDKIPCKNVRMKTICPFALYSQHI